MPNFQDSQLKSRNIEMTASTSNEFDAFKIKRNLFDPSKYADVHDDEYSFE